MIIVLAVALHLEDLLLLDALGSPLPTTITLFYIYASPSPTTKAKDRCLREIPERILIFHAGTPRTTFLACLKVTTLFGLAFFTFLVAPAYIAADKPLLHTVAIVACGIVPFSVIAYTSSPFVVFIHLRLPAFARHPDPELLRRFVRNIPAGTKLDITTMNLVGRPRVTSVPVGDIVPAHERFRIVNFIDSRQSVLAPPAMAPGARYPSSRIAPAPPVTQRPQTKLVAFSSKFPWIHLRQTTRFGAPAGNNSRGVKDGWVWEELLAVVERRAAQQPQSITTK
ncbi:paired amphipathic helix protein [Ophiostoma piceae UAMH 11346]|uniref:Paired amphipathic helix protein n=1 Tax=Ophiostoma piceae (strain UAMH 11346) TaxID=1262450 RepID=S3CTP0_OPHP1|nr:paired amphipathic helix protein [Ophiostoma piceae UAMH 11346]